MENNKAVVIEKSSWKTQMIHFQKHFLESSDCQDSTGRNKTDNFSKEKCFTSTGFSLGTQIKELNVLVFEKTRVATSR